MSVQKRRLKKNGYVAILLAFATPAIIYGVKYAIDKSIFSSWNIFKKQNNEVYKKCATAIAYEVASHWNPVLTLEQQIDSLQKIADETYNTYPEYHGGILGRAIAGLERIDIFDLKSLKVTQRTSMNSKFRYIKYKNADVSYYPYTLTINNNANPYFALYRFVDSVTNEITDSTNKNHKRPLVAMWAYERKNRLPRNILSEADIFIGPASFPKMSDKDKNNKYGPYSSLSNEGAFVFTNALPDDSNFKNSRYSTSGSQAYFLSENNFDTKFATTKNNFLKIGISSISKGSAISDKLMIPDTVSSDNPKVTITLEGKDKIKIEADATDSSDPSKKYKDKDTAYATPAKCKVDIILSIPTNEAACDTRNLDAASITSGSIQTSQVDANKNTADAKLTPIYQIAQAYRTFLKENFFFVQGVNVGLIPYSGKVSLPPNRENWTTSFNAFYSNAFIDDISKFPRKCKPSFRMSILYGTSGLAGAKLYGSTAAADKQLSTASYTWGTTLTGFPIMFRMGLQSLERDTTKQDLLGNKISYGGNYIYTGSILSSENPEKSATKRSYTATMNEPAEPPSALANKFLKMNMNPCYGGYANLLGMKCEQDSPFFLPNPYYIIELTPNVQRIYEILGSLYPFYDTKNVSNFTFIPITWANNLLAEWTDGSTDIAGDTKRISQEKKTSSGRKKVLIFVVNKPDYFEPGELTYLGFNNDYAEFSGVESDKIDFTIPYNSSLYYGDDKQYTGTITGYKRILRFTGTAAKGNGTATSGNFYFPEKALLKVIVESTMQETSPNTIVTCNEIKHQIIGRKTIYVESNTITKKSGNEWYIAISCGAYVKLISGELTNAIQPPRLEWTSGTNVIHSYNGKVPFTMKVQAPDATIKFSPYSSAGANEYSGTYKIPYGKEQTFKFKSKQGTSTSPVGSKQIKNKFSYTLNNTSMSYTISNRKIRWKGGSSGWYDEGLTVLPTANTYTGNDYLNIRMTGIKKYRTEDYWALAQKENVITDKHGWWIFSYYDKCKSYYYYVYEKKSTQADYQEYQPGKITFTLPELFTGNAAINHTNNTELKYNFDNSSTKAPVGAGTNIGSKTTINNANTNSINLSSTKSVNIYQYDEFYSADPKPPVLPSQPSNPTTTFRSRLAWWEYMLIIPAVIHVVTIGVMYINNIAFPAIIRAVQKFVASVESAKKEAPFKTGDKIYYAMFSEDASKQTEYKNIATNGIVNFYGTADINVNVKTLPNKTPSFSLTKPDKSEEKFDFDINNWTPKEESGENIYLRSIYVQSKDYNFNQQSEGGNLFDITVTLENGAKIVSVEPDYDNVDKMVAENNVPKPRIEWNGGNIIKTIGGQTPIKITVSPKEECQITLSSPDGTTVKNDNFKTYSIAYGEKKEFSGLIKADSITMEANGSSYEGAKINKFSYILKNTTMTCDVANRKIRWKGGKNEWSDEGVSILDSECIQKEALEEPVAEGKKTDAHSHLIFTKREDNEDGSYNHVRGRIVWRFPEKITGTASVCWMLNKPFFPTEDQRTTEEKINELTKRIGNENDNKNIIINDSGNIEGETYKKDTYYVDKNGIPTDKKTGTTETNTVIDYTPVIDSLYGSVNLAKKYIGFFEENIKTFENQLLNLGSPVTDAMAKIRIAFTNLYQGLKSVNAAQIALSKAQSLSQDTTNEQRAFNSANNALGNENGSTTHTLYGQLAAAKANSIFSYNSQDILDNSLYNDCNTWLESHNDINDQYKYYDSWAGKWWDKYWSYSEAKEKVNKHKIATAKKSILEIIDAEKEKYQELAAAELKLDSALDELNDIEKDLIKTKLGYYESVMVLGKDDGGNPITTSERKYFDYKIPDESGYNNKEVFPLDNGRYINSDSNGDLSYFTLSTKNDAATINYQKITTDDSIEEDRYWNIHKDTSGTIIPGIENIIPTDTYITSNITLSDKDMLAIFQSKRYLNGQKFYYMEFIQDDSKPLKIPCDVSAPIPELKKSEKSENDTIITEYSGTNVYTKESKNTETMTKNLSIVDPDNQITKTETTDIKSNVTTSSISGTVGFCGTGDISVTATGAPKPYAYIKKLEGVGGVTEKFEFETYNEVDISGNPIQVYEVDSQGKITDKIATDENGNVKYKVAEKAIYIDPYTYKYEPIEGKPNTYQIKIELSNAVINTVEIMSDELAHPELSAHTRMVDGTTGTVPWSGGSDDTKHLDNLKIEGNAYEKLTNSATLVNTKDRASTKMYVLNYPGDANLLIEDTGTFIGSDNTNIGKQTFIGGMIKYETYAPGAIRKFFPFWRDSKYNNYITTSSTSASTNLTMCEFSYPMNAILLFGQQSLSLGDGSFYKYKWQDPATAKTDNRDVYDQANALKYVVRDACTKLKDDYGGDSNVRIYVIKYRAQKQYYSVPYYGNNQRTFNHDYSEIENCASPSTFLGMHLGGRYIYNADSEANLKKALNEIAEDIKEFAKYEDAKCVD